ncbi:hypothetical protein BBR01nite_49690 [Brevibacillus brevis]|nr:hypothetical protein BBR01nite_49690 [Brevibacillus brevis]
MADHYYTNQPGAAHDEQQFTFKLRGNELRFITDAGVFPETGLTLEVYCSLRTWKLTVMRVCSM